MKYPNRSPKLMGYRDNFLRNEHLLTVALLKKGNLTQRYPRYSQRSFIALFTSQHHFSPTVLLHQCIRARVEEEDKSTSPSPYSHYPTWITLRFWASHQTRLYGSHKILGFTPGPTNETLQGQVLEFEL